MAGLRVVLFGTPAFAVPTLEALLCSPHEIVGVVTQPDRPSGRGQRTSHGPVKRLALARGLTVLQPERLRDPVFLDALAALAPQVGVVAAYGKILPDSVLTVPRMGLLNVHASLLPKYRGAAPVHRAVLAGETRTGVSIMQVVRELDAGPVFATAEAAIGPDETSEELERRLAVMGAELLLRVLDEVADGRAVAVPQDDAEATYAPRLTKEEGLIDWSRPAGAIHNQVRGLTPWPRAYTSLGSTRYVIHQTAVDTGPPPAGQPAGQPGLIVEAHGDRLAVLAGEHTRLRLLRAQPEGRRIMTARELVAGRHLSAGLRFGST